jgi:LPS O-antigen subunit length determinant protein (WzzB/FepE family)
MSEALVNKVANSGLITIDLETFLPKEEILVFDLKDYLFMGLILKEKDFREALKQKDWTDYNNRYVSITCSTDAIIPLWAYMLISTYLQPVAKDLYVGTQKEMYKHLVLKAIDQFNTDSIKDQRVVIKGCGDNEIESYAYAEITKVLTPVVKSIMYGEPCSTVPIYKKKT